MEGYHAVMDCFNKTVKLRVDETDRNVQVVRERKKIKTHVISTLKAERLMKVRCEGFIAFITRINDSKWRRY